LISPALPTVYSGSIKLDLGRRDFTINTLAVQFSPSTAAGRILDFYGGLRDLQQGLIRVLHNLSFVDDPTRMLRAVRFELRLGFQIEPRSAELMQTALPMLRRITGERVRNELNLLLREREPGRGLLMLQERSLLSAIHPAFAIQPEITEQFEKVRTVRPVWMNEPSDLTDLYWHSIAAGIELEALPSLLERLLMPHQMADSMIAAAKLLHDDLLRHLDTRPSQIDARLYDIAETALLTVWLLSDDARAREQIERYVMEWRHIRPTTNGHRLMERGLKPGPCYAILLNRLRAARLDGEVSDDAAETALLEKLLAEGVCDDGA
jgi:tRNA nucleotidyltransferase (CCA-adding enzyme)